MHWTNKMDHSLNITRPSTKIGENNDTEMDYLTKI